MGWMGLLLEQHLNYNSNELCSKNELWEGSVLVRWVFSSTPHFPFFLPQGAWPSPVTELLFLLSVSLCCMLAGV